MSIWTGAFWKATAERAVSTAAQAAILAFGAEQFDAIAIPGSEWLTVAGFAAGGALLSVLKALAAGAGDGNPSVGSREVIAPLLGADGRGGYLEGHGDGYDIQGRGGYLEGQ